jgi:hypothetical protein
LKLVDEDEYGAFLGVHPEFLEEFSPREINPNFEVYDSLNGYNRFIASKCSRIPDDEDLAKEKYGIDFHRRKPTQEEARQYGAGLPSSWEWLSDIAFAAETKEEYQRKASTWDNFYAYVFSRTQQTVWVAPHSGRVNRPPDDLMPYPEFMVDSGTAGVAAWCAFHDGARASKRTMINIHSTGQLGAVLNLGDFGVVAPEKLDSIAEKMERKYHKKAQALAREFTRDFCEKTLKLLEHIYSIRGTLDPAELGHHSGDDSFTVRTYIRCLKHYGRDIAEFTLAEFSRVLRNLDKIEVPVILNNFIYPARNVGKLLKLSDMIEEGLLHTALHIEGAKLYMARDPELLASIILDIKNELVE